MDVFQLDTFVAIVHIHRFQNTTCRGILIFVECMIVCFGAAWTRTNRCRFLHSRFI